MAKAKATCKCSTCGAEFDVTSIKSSSREARSWEEWAVDHYDVCPECQKKAYREQSAEYAAQAAEDGLPSLKGTEKQIAWAETIRHDKIVAINSLIQEKIEKKRDETVAKMELTLSHLLTIDSAKWWIENRYWDSWALIKSNYQAALDAQAVKNAVEDEAAEEEEKPKENTVVTPENVQFGTVVITVSDGSVDAYYPKDEIFRKVVKSSGFSWDSPKCCWEKEITNFSGTAVDRAADISNKLLMAGFSVDCKNADVRQKAVSGNFEPECKRWIKRYVSGTYEGWLAIDIPREDTDSEILYKAARKIKDSKWANGNGSVAAPIAQCDSVEDFAEIYGYRLSDTAKRAIAEYRNQKLAEIMEPQRAEKPDVLGDILKSSCDVLDDLKDD